eukprot:811156-Prorocentrum_minimum.AAC.4
MQADQPDVRATIARVGLIRQAYMSLPWFFVKEHDCTVAIRVHRRVVACSRLLARLRRELGVGLLGFEHLEIGVPCTYDLRSLHLGVEAAPPPVRVPPARDQNQNQNLGFRLKRLPVRSDRQSPLPAGTSGVGIFLSATASTGDLAQTRSCFNDVLKFRKLATFLNKLLSCCERHPLTSCIGTTVARAVKISTVELRIGDGRAWHGGRVCYRSTSLEPET